MEKPNIIAIVPAFNVAPILKKTIEEIPADSFREVIVIDDASTDDTATVAQQLGVTVITHLENTGYGGAQKTGYKKAIELGAEGVVMVHGDNQYDPTIADQFAEKISQEGYELVTGTRMILGDVLSAGMPMWKFIPNRFLTWLENKVFGTHISDYHNGYRAYSVEFLKKIPLDLLSDKFDFDTDIMIQGAIRKSKIGEIPHPTRYLDENSQMSFGKGIIYGLCILKTVSKFLLHKVRVQRQKIYEAN